METLFGLLEFGLIAAFSIIWVAVLVSMLWSKIAWKGEAVHARRSAIGLTHLGQ